MQPTCQGPNVAKPQDCCSIGDDANKMALGRVLIGVFFVLLNGQARLRNTCKDYTPVKP